MMSSSSRAGSASASPLRIHASSSSPQPQHGHCHGRRRRRQQQQQQQQQHKKKSSSRREVKMVSLSLAFKCAILMLGLLLPFYNLLALYDATTATYNKASMTTTIIYTKSSTTAILASSVTTSEAERTIRFSPRVVRLENDADNAEKDIKPSTAAAAAVVNTSTNNRVSTRRIVDALGAPCCKDYKHYQHRKMKSWNGGGECKPMADWQSWRLTTCNLVHEHNLVDVIAKETYLGRGNWRAAWRVRETTQTMTSSSSTTTTTTFTDFVFRTLRIRPMFPPRDTETPQLLEQVRVDALALERLVGKGGIAILPYAYCGHALVTESGEMTLMEKYYNPSMVELPSVKRLELGVQVANILSHIHSIDHHHPAQQQYPTLVHGDFGRTNILVTHDDRLVVNDFNQGILLRAKQQQQQQHHPHRHAGSNNHTTTTNNATEICNYANKRFFGLPWKSRPPERFNATTYVKSHLVDVFALGIVLVELLLGEEQPFRHAIATRALARQPRTLPLPVDLYESQDAAVLALLYAALACFATVPEHRPSAFRVTQGLQTVLQWLQPRQKNEDQPHDDHGKTESTNITITANEIKPLFLDNDAWFAGVKLNDADVDDDSNSSNSNSADDEIDDDELKDDDDGLIESFF